MSIDNEICARKDCGHRKRDHVKQVHPIYAIIRGKCKIDGCTCEKFIGRG